MGNTIPKNQEYILIVSGSELLSGKRQDKHTRFITRELFKLGLICQRCTFVGDHASNLSQVIGDALKHADLLIITGGLGPTVDDITRESLSEATGILLREEKRVVDMIRARLASMGREMRENNRKQALVPNHGTYFPNHHGTAPGLVFDAVDKVAVALPGPPRELAPMVRDQLVPYLKDRYPDLTMPRMVTFHTCGLGESNIDDLMQQELGNVEGLQFSYLAGLGVVETTLYLLEDSPGAARRLEESAAKARKLLGGAVFSETGETLEEAAGRLLRERGQTVSVAESCTGGLVGAAITAVPGSSAYFPGGCVAYSNESKIRDLSVNPETLKHHGAVSRETVSEMALGARQRFGADWSLAVTGVAGPGGGTDGKPAGTVWIAAADPQGAVHPFKVRIKGDRETVRNRSCVLALDQLRRLLSGVEPYR